MKVTKGEDKKKKIKTILKKNLKWKLILKNKKKMYPQFDFLKIIILFT